MENSSILDSLKEHGISEDDLNQFLGKSQDNSDNNEQEMPQNQVNIVARHDPKTGLVWHFDADTKEPIKIAGRSTYGFGAMQNEPTPQDLAFSQKAMAGAGQQPVQPNMAPTSVQQINPQTMQPANPNAQGQYLRGNQ